MRDVHDRPALRRLLAAEPEAALRILTSRDGPVQVGIVDALQRVLEQERQRGTLELEIDSETMAYVIVRLGESFLYADVIADNRPDVGTAVKMIARLLRS
jgi:Tetracyclin repressor-like, C-terminal domain